MSDDIEVYADQMSMMSIGNGGTIAKLVFTSNIPDMNGQMVPGRKVVVTLPVNQLQRMLKEIRNAGVETDPVGVAATAASRRLRARN